MSQRRIWLSWTAATAAAFGLQALLGSLLYEAPAPWPDGWSVSRPVVAAEGDVPRVYYWNAAKPDAELVCASRTGEAWRLEVVDKSTELDDALAAHGGGVFYAEGAGWGGTEVRHAAPRPDGWTHETVFVSSWGTQVAWLAATNDGTAVAFRTCRRFDCEWRVAERREGAWTVVDTGIHDAPSPYATLSFPVLAGGAGRRLVLFYREPPRYDGSDPPPAMVACSQGGAWRATRSDWLSASPESLVDAARRCGCDLEVPASAVPSTDPQVAFDSMTGAVFVATKTDAVIDLTSHDPAGGSRARVPWEEDPSWTDRAGVYPTEVFPYRTHAAGGRFTIAGLRKARSTHHDQVVVASGPVEDMRLDEIDSVTSSAAGRRDAGWWAVLWWAPAGFLFLGTFQWLVLRRIARGLLAWIPATFLGQLLAAFLTPVVGGAVLGVCQAFVPRATLRWRAAFAALVAGTWALRGLANQHVYSLITLFPDSIPAPGPELGFFLMACVSAAEGAAWGTVTGIAVSRLPGHLVR